MEIKNYKLSPDPRSVQSFGSSSIYLSITIGNGQTGGNYVTMNDKVIAKGDLSFVYLIGDVELLKGNTITIQTNVLDLNPFTNKCVITTKFLNEKNNILFQSIDDGEAPECGIAIFKGNYVIV